ncbi:unnamed protein product, partial [Owenia fusiformis]
VRAEDSGKVDGIKTSTLSYTVTITDVNDNTPAFNPAAYVFTIEEDSSTGTTVGTLTATDIDDGANQDLSYTITSGNTDNIFRVDKIIATQVAELIIDDSTNLDYEASQKYSMVLTATDRGSLSSTARIEVIIHGINEETPVFIPSSVYTSTIAESSAPGSVIMTVSATDGDIGKDGDVFYTLVSGASGKFSIDSISGDLKIISKLDYETQIAYTLLISCADNGINPTAYTSTGTVSVFITDSNDEAPVCTQNSYVVSLSENTSPGDVITTLMCSDTDGTSPNRDLLYEMTSGDATFFGINMNQLVVWTGASFDYELVKTFSVTIKVKDQGVPQHFAMVEVTVQISGVNEHPPVFSAAIYKISVIEDAAIGTSIGRIIATDADEGTDGDVRFTISN